MSFLRKVFQPFKNTPFHPQWLSYRDNVLRVWLSVVDSNALVLDIGCNDRWVQQCLPNSVDYIGLDYLSKSSGYHSCVDLYGDAHKLPMADGCVDVVVLFDVLEHLEYVDVALDEIFRVLKEGGCVLIQVPFIYPIHDAPYDFTRLTEFGWIKLLEEKGFVEITTERRGGVVETACLLFNISIAKLMLSAFERFGWLALMLSPFVSTFFIIFNFLGWVFSGRSKGLMPFSYQFKFKRN